MRAAFSSRTDRRGLAGLVLFAFLLRALIPAGFMPSADRPFTLELCPATFPAAWLAKAGNQGSHAEHAQHHHHHAEHAGHATNDTVPAEKSGFEHCPFGTAPSVAPGIEPGITPLHAEPASVPDFIDVSAPPARLIRSQKARAPPVFS
ncbi:MAG TPA: hypothetical protein VIL32_17055 [Steroidobacteraceae bacterium]